MDRVSIARMTPNQMIWWEKIRVKGKLKFVLLRGVLFWGVLTAILSAVVNEWWHAGLPFTSAEYSLSSLIDSLIVGIVIFPIVGAFLSLYIWKICEDVYLSS